MATPAEVEAALAVQRAALAKLHEIASKRDAAVRQRNVATATVTDLNAQIITARTAVNDARVALQALLAAPIVD